MNLDKFINRNNLKDDYILIYSPNEGLGKFVDSLAGPSGVIQSIQSVKYINPNILFGKGRVTKKTRFILVARGSTLEAKSFKKDELFEEDGKIKEDIDKKWRFFIERDVSYLSGEINIV